MLQLRNGIDLTYLRDAGFQSVITFWSLLLAFTLINPARDLTSDAASAAGSARTINSRPSNKDLSFVQVKGLLDSRADREVLEGLRKVISVGCQCSSQLRILMLVDDVSLKTLPTFLFCCC